MTGPYPLAEGLSEERIRRDLPDFVEGGDRERRVELGQMRPKGIPERTARSEPFEPLEALLVREDVVGINEIRARDGEEALEYRAEDVVRPSADALLAPSVLDGLQEVACETFRPPLELGRAHRPAVWELQQVQGDRGPLPAVLLEGGGMGQGRSGSCPEGRSQGAGRGGRG